MNQAEALLDSTNHEIARMIQQEIEKVQTLLIESNDALGEPFSIPLSMYKLLKLSSWLVILKIPNAQELFDTQVEQAWDHDQKNALLSIGMCENLIAKQAALLKINQKKASNRAFAHDFFNGNFQLPYPDRTDAKRLIDRVREAETYSFFDNVGDFNPIVIKSVKTICITRHSPIPSDAKELKEYCCSQGLEDLRKTVEKWRGVGSEPHSQLADVYIKLSESCQN